MGVVHSIMSESPDRTHAPTMSQPHATTEPTPGLYFAVLPGPTRRRAPGLYYYRLVYRDPGPPGEPGCAAVWDVLGGRLHYQIALERDDADRFHWHCTCADAVYRAEGEGRVCKHVRGLCEFTPALPPPVVPVRRAA
jgi:hypothetical protein